MLLRDGLDGLEVFVLRRTSNAAFAGGMYVFPGGRVDEADGEGDLGYRVAALRECFEEAGVLLARDAAGTHVGDGHPVLAHRHDVHEGVVDLRALCDEHGLTLDLDDLPWVAHWITPKGETARRFDTRFFVAVAPVEQVSQHDDTETVASEWVRPADALRRQREGELMMMPPTIANLEFLARHHDASSAMEAARQVGTPSCILPKIRFDAEGRLAGVAMPWDDDYPTLPD
jgi:8-oxo-dGTP pyrophosphatase MutT (NUDIX family)